VPPGQSLQTQAKQWREVKKTLRTQFQHPDLRPGQEEVIRSILNGENVLAIMPTGAGKSLCYQLPALQLTGMTIVVSPLISLMKDQRESVEEKGINAVEINSSIAASQVQEGLERIAADDAAIIYVTPERFTNPEFIADMKDTPLDFVVIDEAHCVSQWGHDFRPAYLAISEALKEFGNPPVMALTATATEEVAADIQKQLGLKKMNVFRSSVLRENLQFEAKYLESADEKMQAVLDLARELKDSSGIIYTATVAAAKQIHEFLAENGVQSILYHGKLKAKEREANQNEFMNNTPRLMIATNAFGMGIDKPDIRYVIHFQFPASLEAYYQEAGRAGRDGESARCILLYLKKDKCTQSLFLAGKYPSADEVEKVYVTLQAFSKKPLEFRRASIEEKLSEHMPVKKISVIFSLLKQMKVLREMKSGELKLLKPALTPGQLAKLADIYRERSDRDREKLNRVITYAQSALCRWRNILQYFGEEPEPESCGHCDNCLAPKRRELSELLTS